MMYQGGVAKFDKATQKFQTWKVPDQWQTDATKQAFLDADLSTVDGKVWGEELRSRADPAARSRDGQWENLGSFKDPRQAHHHVLRHPADHDNNLYLLDFSSRRSASSMPRPASSPPIASPIPSSRPRRGRVDEQNRLWFAEYGGNAIGMFDPKTEKSQEWVLPTPWAQPYDVVTDKNGEAWTGSMLSDRVSRLDPKTGEHRRVPDCRGTPISAGCSWTTRPPR
jgi:streptogramin lyase